MAADPTRAEIDERCGVIRAENYSARVASGCRGDRGRRGTGAGGSVYVLAPAEVHRRLVRRVEGRTGKGAARGPDLA